METDEGIVVIDAGLMLPDPDMPGIDLIIPDISYLVERSDKLAGIVLTHGHDDHIGGLPYMLRRISAPIYGTKLTLTLLQDKLREFGITEVEMEEVKPGDSIKLGGVEIEFIRVCHSIPDSVALAIHTPAGTIVHSGDFKLDQTPVDGQVMDLHRFAELGRDGVLLLLSDSTNSERPGYSPSERSIFPELDAIFASSRGRIFASTFASSIFRIQQFVELAAKHGRYIAIAGRSMVQNVRIARDLGYLWLPENLTVDLKGVMNLPPEKVMVMTTGSQGEPLSALSLMATDSYKLKIEEGDTVIISARIIPGHEKAIGRIINHLYRRGADVYYERIANVHASGHAYQEELKLMLNLTRPKYFIPIHGEYRQLVHHARIAEGIGIPSRNILIAQDGDVISLREGECYLAGSIPADKVLIDGKAVDGVGDVVLRDRKRMARDGMVIPIVVLDGDGELVAGPDMVSKGFLPEGAEDGLMEEAKKLIIDLLEGMSREEKEEMNAVQEEIRTALRRFFSKKVDSRPMVIPVVMKV
ncbi:ribonuclease J [Candidatus Poribacteria bacterium]|nr:MAG: ribonuclease J [Candidatus Poribacteria bacterium]